MDQTDNQSTRCQKCNPDVLMDIFECLPFPFKPERETGEGWSWSWTSQYSEFNVQVKANLKLDYIRIYIRDTRTNRTFDRWSSKVIMTGAWRNRLRQAAGEALILAQRRPKCPRCQEEMILCARKSDNEQFFGCSAHPKCHGLRNIVDHDIDRTGAGNRAVSTHLLAAPKALANTASHQSQ